MMKFRWKNKEYRNKQKITRQTDEYKNKMSVSIKKAYESTELRNQMSIIMKDDWKRNKNERIKSMNSDKCLKRKSEILKERWEDISYMEMMCNMSNDLWQNKEHVEKMKKIHTSEQFRKQASSIVTELWKDPIYASKCLNN
ncbi:MAG TPA: hypothetical protein P5509_05435, partial [Bacteroidales bacterium]|nr:hypothetical protein [Bacteroidales bacterium]